jgi:hypothetical protein
MKQRRRSNRGRSNRTRLFLLFGVLPLALALTPSAGCVSDGAELCDLRCECEPCNDREEDECDISADELADAAEAYGCEAEYEKYITCAIGNNSCDEDDNDFEIDEDCIIEDQADLFECMADASDRTGSSGPGPGPGPGSGGSTSTSTSVGGSGAGGSSPCATCGEAAAGTATLDQTCGFTDGCPGTSSCGLAQALLTCTCGSCAADCQFTCTMSGMDTAMCSSCAQTSCANELNACLGDVGGGG